MGEAIALLDRLRQLCPPEARGALDSAQLFLESPLKIAVAGRVNTGKSTLVNALVGSLVAPTATQELTSVPTVYVFGSPPSATAVMDDGGRAHLALSAAGPVLPSQLLARTRMLEVQLQLATLREATILDTPGLGSVSSDNSPRTNTVLLSTAEEQFDPDLVLYLVRDAFRPDDFDFIREFKSLDSLMGPSRRRIVAGVISHADSYGGGAWQQVDPFVAAGAAASALVAGKDLAFVVPVSGLMAETARCGMLTEQFTTALAQLAPLSPEQLRFAGQVGAGAFSGEEIQALIARVGQYGLLHGRTAATSSQQLLQWLEYRSGMSTLEGHIMAGGVQRSYFRRIEMLRDWLMAQGRNNCWGPQAGSIIEISYYSEDFHKLQENAAYELLVDADPGHELVQVLGDLLADAQRPEWLAPETIAREIRHYHGKVAESGSGVVAQSYRVIAKSLEIMLNHARGADLESKPFNSGNRRTWQ